MLELVLDCSHLDVLQAKSPDLMDFQQTVNRHPGLLCLLVSGGGT